MMAKNFTRRAVTRSITIAATPARTFQALTDPHDLNRWWGANEAIIALRKGGVWTLGWHAFGQDNFYVTSAFIDKFTGNHELRLRDVWYFRPDMKPLGPMKLSFRLQKQKRETTVTVRQTGYGSGKIWRSYHRAVEDGWEKSLWSLKKYLERKAR